MIFSREPGGLAANSELVLREPIGYGHDSNPEGNNALVEMGREVKTRHSVDGALIKRPHFLQIARYAADSCYYLFYCDENRDVVTDTLHDTVEGALAQAEFEFGVSPQEWVELD